MREVLEDLNSQAKNGRDAAKEMSNNVKELLQSYTQRIQAYLNEMSSVEDQIHNINRGVDLVMVGISTDCIDQCKTDTLRNSSDLWCEVIISRNSISGYNTLIAQSNLGSPKLNYTQLIAQVGELECNPRAAKAITT